MHKILGAARRAVEDYEMIAEGDRVCVGVSGGKDSAVLLYALNELSKFYPRHFTVVGITLDMGMDGMDFTPMVDFCAEHGIEYHIKKTSIYQIIFDVRKEKNPCSLCSKLRRGALHNAAQEYHCNVVALGHHNDDVLETLLMNLVHEGRFGCFSPKTFLDRREITVIRPLIYLTEGEVLSCVKRNNIPVIKSNCPANGETQRHVMQEKLKEMQKEYPDIREKLFGALQRSGIDGWADVERGRKVK